MSLLILPGLLASMAVARPQAPPAPMPPPRGQAAEPSPAPSKNLSPPQKGRPAGPTLPTVDPAKVGPPRGAKTPPPRPSVDTFELKEALTGATPEAFARRLSRLLGAEVRLPEKLAVSLLLPRGRWSAAGALNHIAQQIQGDWHQEFVFRRDTSGPMLLASKLASVGQVTAHKEKLSFEQAARLIARPIRCKVETAKPVAGTYDVAYKQLPIEQALVDLGNKAELSVSAVIVFKRADPDPERQQEELQNEEAEALSHQAELRSTLEAITGYDPTDPNFPWLNLPPNIWGMLGLSAEEGEDLQLQAQMESRSAEQQTDANPDEEGG
ncbi:MAG TPA: hypothetical protein VFB21_22210 [Chthonomonadaceae bacterium]|nr:hypothetical protein [Chthonomonadaceae bacterium]